MRSALFAAALALAAAGCGQKGALYYRDNPPAGVKPPKAAPYQPTPYPKGTDEDSGASDSK